ncbi:hypothetical protein [Niveispirillum sp. BGYR6]|uniref:hypothetical protein n=1 Tax=Niveispirillum sp. BGYR6 TaxID=2971249 RepID=UPI0022B9CA75|nr:hypothetical protein [Niveispirillum sp. BGYR6]MDG5496511.1 hypothetical protein [Niveispirillum sp. BGYR6]
MKGDPAAQARMDHQLRLLHDDLARLEKRCAALSPPADVTHALRQFKELTPLFETVDSFVTVAGSYAQRLETDKLVQVEEQLTRLQTLLWHLRLTAVAPILECLAEDMRHMPLGSRFVMERWRDRLADLHQHPAVQTGLPPTLLSHIEELTRRLISSAPDLIAFD